MSDSPARLKYGKYLPHQRLNVDQIPIPLLVDMDTTYEEKGAKRVTINQRGPSLAKRMCTGQVCFRPVLPPKPDAADAAAVEKYKKLRAQPAICLVFRGKGLRISKVRARAPSWCTHSKVSDSSFQTQAELDAYPDELVVLWQEKAWVDGDVALEWLKKVYQPFIKAELEAAVATSEDRYLLIEDNLGAQCEDDYINFLRDKCATDDHKVPANKTDQVQPVDRGLGRQIKLYLGEELEDWLEDETNMKKWEEGTLTASEKRIMMAHWYVTAVKKALASSALPKYFEHAGALLTADGSDDDKIKLESAPVGYKQARLSRCGRRARRRRRALVTYFIKSLSLSLLQSYRNRF